MASDKTPFDRAQEARTKVDALTATKVKVISDLKAAKADLRARTAEVLKAIGRKPRQPRTKKQPAVVPAGSDLDRMPVGDGDVS